MIPSTFPLSLIQAKTDITTEPTDLLITIKTLTDIQFTVNDSLLLNIPLNFNFDPTIAITCQSVSPFFSVLPCVGSQRSIVIQLTSLIG